MKNIEVKTHLISAKNKVLGRLASEIARILIGKDKESYRPNVDGGDFVVVEDVEKIKITGNKLEQKKYYHHTLHPGGLKAKKMKDVFQKNPAEVLRKAVWNMLPKNRLRKLRIKKLQFK